MESQKKVVNYILQHGTRLSNSELALATEGVPVLKWTNVTSGWEGHNVETRSRNPYNGGPGGPLRIIDGTGTDL